VAHQQLHRGPKSHGATSRNSREHPCRLKTPAGRCPVLLCPPGFLVRAPSRVSPWPGRQPFAALRIHKLTWQIGTLKSPAAHRKLTAVHRDCWKMTSGGHTDLKLEFNWDHFPTITDFLNFGFDRFTPEELADCFDEICPCGLRRQNTSRKFVQLSGKRAIAIELPSPS
jgi:hypothetical protein